MSFVATIDRAVVAPDEGDDRRARGLKPRHERTGRAFERARPPQRLHHGEDAEQADEGPHVEIPGVGGVGRNRRRARQRAKSGNAQHDVPARKAPRRARRGHDKPNRAHAPPFAESNVKRSFSRTFDGEGRMKTRNRRGRNDMPLIELNSLDDPHLLAFSRMTDAELRDPKQMVGLSRALGSEPKSLARGFSSGSRKT